MFELSNCKPLTLENLCLPNLNQYLSYSGSILSLLLFKWKPLFISFLINDVPGNFWLGSKGEKENLCKRKFKGKNSAVPLQHFFKT